MSLIFHRFRDAAWALSFAESVHVTWGREWVICSAQDDANCIDPFPYELTPPIVLIERLHEGDEENEALMEAAVAGFYGEMAGT